MLIVNVIFSLERGGAETMLSRLCIANKEHECVVISLTSIGELGKMLTSKGIKVIALGVNSPINIFGSYFSLYKAFNDLKPDIVQTWMYYADLIAGIAARMSGVKNVVWGIRNTQIPQHRFSIHTLMIYSCSVLSPYIPDKIICCAQSALFVHSKKGYCLDKMVVVPNGYDLSEYRPSLLLSKMSRFSFHIDGHKTVIGIIGRFDKLKDYNNFINAALYVSDNCSNVLFVMVGKGVDYSNNDIMDVIDSTAYKDNFILLGERNDIPFVLSMFDIFCLSSIAEGFPNVVAEAMAMKIPCVVTDVGDAADIVGNAGIVVKPRQPIALGKAVLDLATKSRSSRSVMGGRARNIIERKYSIESIVTKYNKIYESISFRKSI